MSHVRAGRLRKTTLFFKQQGLFFETLHADIARLHRKALKLKKKAFVRLNGTSDIDFGKYKVFNGKTIFQEFPDVQFYDYSKDPDKCINNKEPNYHLTFSKSENNLIQTMRVLQAGINVAVVFKTKDLPKTYLGHKVINGDKTDLRFEEGYQGAIVGLYAKGKARRDTSGFVIDNTQAVKKTA
jgi:hypothetical protein